MNNRQNTVSRPQLSGKIVIITGGSRGLGRATALGFARAGAAGITITASRTTEELESAAREIDEISGPGHSLAVRADVTSWQDCQDTVDRTLEKFGGVHVLVNNAGKGQRTTSPDRAPFWEADIEGWRQVIDTNINGPFYMARAVVFHLMERGWGRIINISKSLDSMHRRHATPYGPSKAALEAATMSWAQDLDGTGVTVNTLAPGGGVDTDFVQPAVRERAATESRMFLAPEIIVPAAVWLASDQSGGITGCRYIARLWDKNLPPDQAAEAARDPAIFRPPKRPQLLTRTWTPQSLPVKTG